MEEKSFNPLKVVDRRDRIKILSPNEPEEDLPSYVDFSRKIRNELRSALYDEDKVEVSQSLLPDRSKFKEKWPTLPKNIVSVEDLFAKVDEEVSKAWVQKIWGAESEDKILDSNGILAEKCIQWANEVNDESLKALLLRPDLLERKIRARHFDALEGLRKANPEAWRSLILASSERQLAKMTLFRHWIRELPEEDFEKLGFSRDELIVFSDIAGVCGKYIDHEYIKQLEIADSSGGSEKTPLGDIDDLQGAKFVYEAFDAGRGSKNIPYVEIFATELTGFRIGLEKIATKVQLYVENGRLPREKYGELPNYLRDLALQYASSETNPEVLFNQWQSLSNRGNQLINVHGCPIVIIPQETEAHAGEANKVDAELSLGLVTKDSRKLEAKLKKYSEKVQELNDQNSNKLDNPNRTVPDTTLTFQPFAHGPNVYAVTLGQGGEGFEYAHLNALGEVAEYEYLPLVKKLLKIVDVDQEAYIEAVNILTSLHEKGHAIFPLEDKAVIGRLGDSTEAHIIEELKAEAATMKLLLEVGEDDLSDEEKRTYLLASLGFLSDYVVNKSSEKGSDGERYHYAGVAILSRLVQEGVLVIDEDSYMITDYDKGLKVIRDLCDEVLNKFYFNENVSEEEIINYGENLRKQESGSDVQNFINILNKQ